CSSICASWSASWTTLRRFSKINLDPHRGLSQGPTIVERCLDVSPARLKDEIGVMLPCQSDHREPLGCRARELSISATLGPRGEAEAPWRHCHGLSKVLSPSALVPQALRTGAPFLSTSRSIRMSPGLQLKPLHICLANVAPAEDRP